MTYIEKALYDFVKTILTRGIRTLKDPQYLPYSLFLLVVVGTSTVAAFIGDITGIAITEVQKDILLYVELSAAIAFLVVGLVIGKMRTSIQMTILFLITLAMSLFWWLDLIEQPNDVALFISAIFYIAWITVAAFSTFSLFRDLFENDVFGMVLFMGKPKDDGRPMFSLIAMILVFLNIGLGYFIYQQGSGNSTALTYSGIIIIVTAIIAFIPLLNLQRKYDVFFTILTTFYMFTTIRVVILAFKSLTATPGNTSVWDTIFSLFIALYAIQNAAVKGIKIGEVEPIEMSVEEKLMEEEKSTLGFTSRISAFLGNKGVVLIILGLVLGFHTMQVQSFLGRQNIFNDIEYTADADIILLGYEVNLAVSLLIYVLSLIAFLLIPAFRRYANPSVRRIEWAPEYDDLKLLALSFKDGALDWKSESLKLAGSISKNKLQSIISGSKTTEDVIGENVSKWVEKAKKKKQEKLDEKS